LPITGIKYLTQLFNTVLLKRYFSVQWKVAQIILILNPGRLPTELSYWPISLLPTLSTVFENNGLIMINEAIENKQYCSAPFLRHLSSV
jgi:hypothetical protein